MTLNDRRSLDHCGVKLYVHFLDLWQQESMPLDTYEERNEWHDRWDRFEEGLWDIDVPGCEVTETCMNHQCWLALEVDLLDIEDDLERVARDCRTQILSLLCKVWG